MPLRSTWGNNR